MSHVMMARRLLGVILRRPSLSHTSASCLANVLQLQQPHDAVVSTSSTSYQPAWSLSQSVSSSNQSLFSSVSSKKKEDETATIVELPPNLKFDPRAKSSPFYGAERVVKSEKKNKGRGKETKYHRARDNRLETTSVADNTRQLLASDEPSSVSVNQALDSSSEVMKDNDEADIGDDKYEINYNDEDVDDDDDDEEEERILFDLSTKPDIPRAIPLPQRLHIPILDIRSGETVGSYHLSEKTFGNDPIRVDILHRVVVWQRNKKRGKRNAGARTKTVSEVRGSGRKVRQQKGSGKARAGHSRPAHWRGGAKAHGPKGRIQDYTTKLNKKVRKMGVRHALSQKLKEGNLIVTNDLHAPTHKTKELEIMLNRLGISGKKGVNALFVDDAKAEDYDDDGENTTKVSVYGGLDVNFKVASGNLQKVKMLNQLGCNVYDMLKFRKLVLSLAAVTSLEERLERDL
jgi:large subunit ribosomal protein L4